MVKISDFGFIKKLLDSSETGAGGKDREDPGGICWLALGCCFKLINFKFVFIISSYLLVSIIEKSQFENKNFRLYLLRT